MKEVNFDGLVGPTHNYAGLSFGNLASMKHRLHISNPKQAALQGLDKMKRVMDLGIIQGVLPPPERPAVAFLRSIGFTGSDAQVIEKAAKSAPTLLQAVSSASSMWRANSATTTPSCDSFDGRVHLTVANLSTQFHRSLEAQETLALFRFLFADPETFAIHPPLPFPDEGAANHIRFCLSYESKGTHLYVYGRDLYTQEAHLFPARQTRDASEAVARIHGGAAVFAQQNPILIDKGVFHNDVISCGNRETFLYHQEAFVNTEEVIKEIQKYCPVKPIKIELSVEEAVRSYFFNSQLLTLPDQTRLLLAPEECRELSLEWLPFPVDFINIRESMQNGGGPACLRLAIPLTKEEIGKIHQPIFLTQHLYVELKEWIEKHYRDRLAPEDLGDPALLEESREAIAALFKILKIKEFAPQPLSYL
ncbi:MAG: N-succinylarginine dihydrolase [Chlamydiales bacterium]|nr:N-succinylarginine dihydrolase [Chlamydiales bacterium]